MESSQRRKEGRFDVDQPVQVTVLGDRELQVAARLVDVSRSGVRLLLDRSLSFGTAVKVSWKDRQLLGSVRYCGSEGAAYSAGIQLFSSWESLAEEVLARQANEASRSYVELQEFAYAVSHDLTEHLRMIISYLQLLERQNQEKTDVNSSECISYAVNGANRMHQLLGELLLYSQVTRSPVELAPVRLNEILSRAIESLEEEIQESGASITREALPLVLGNEQELVLLFRNLLGNGLKFRGAGRPEMHISVKQQGAEWLFAVRDNGIGIETRFLERIFGVFQQLHTKSEYPGAGLGLATCRRILERHGGRIWAESGIQAGSVFYFTLPRSEWESD